MKLTKENIYISLQGKSEEELTELYWLLKNSNQIMFRYELEDFLLYTDDEVYFLDFDGNDWGSSDLSVKLHKTEVTIQQLKEILQPMGMIDLMGYSVLVDNDDQARKLQELAIEQGFKWIDGVGGIRVLGERSFQFGYGGRKTITYTLHGKHYQDQHVTKKAHFNDLFETKFTPTAMRCTQEQFEAIKPKLKGCKIGGMDNFEEMPYLINYRCAEKNSITNYLPEDKSVYGMVVHEEWDEELFLKSCGIEVEKETLQEKEQRLLKELEEVRKKIEVQNKPKAGDWCKFWDNDTDEFIIGKFQEEYEDTYVTSDTHFYNCKKITNPQLIELLENENMLRV